MVRFRVTLVALVLSLSLAAAAPAQVKLERRLAENAASSFSTSSTESERPFIFQFPAIKGFMACAPSCYPVLA